MHNIPMIPLKALIVAQGLAHLPLVLGVQGSIPAPRPGKISVSEHAGM